MSTRGRCSADKTWHDLLSTSLIFLSQGIQAVLKFSKSLWNLIHFWDLKKQQHIFKMIDGKKHTRKKDNLLCEPFSSSLCRQTTSCLSLCPKRPRTYPQTPEPPCWDTRSHVHYSELNLCYLSVFIYVYYDPQLKKISPKYLATPNSGWRTHLEFQTQNLCDVESFCNAIFQFEVLTYCFFCLFFVMILWWGQYFIVTCMFIAFLLCYCVNLFLL